MFTSQSHLFTGGGLKNSSVTCQKSTSICIGVTRKKRRINLGKRGRFAASAYRQGTGGKALKEEEYQGDKEPTRLFIRSPVVER